ncbi:hypothetical protein TSAR_010786 [Trichomalopsis sarcophagae]|uniref:Uncharacterized protein n=1 Tax=Trichomalopsis sarcophagae TaxID=543379 RepID=A0A232EGE1_9HYME|nr:hypothetical protein TSAR_010786 [Trichomalopsis sarcophagae]
MKSWYGSHSIPLLKNILNDEALKHYQLLVKSKFTLLKDNILEFELNNCEKDLKKFVCQFQDLYGLEAMTFNVHSLMHCVQSVRQTGPLHLNSAFTFENSIYNLKQYINGSKGMDIQIARKHLQKLVFQYEAKNAVKNASEETMTYCFNIFSQKKLTLRYKQIENITFCGKGVLKNYEETARPCNYQNILYLLCSCSWDDFCSTPAAVVARDNPPRDKSGFNKHMNALLPRYGTYTTPQSSQQRWERSKTSIMQEE